MTKRIVLMLSVGLIILMLFIFKYYNFTVLSINHIFHAKISTSSITAPLGISFIVFSSISYLVDIYRGLSKPGTIIDCALYLTFFPKVVSGPIVLWRDFQPFTTRPSISADTFVCGINRMIIGFSKKIILADMFGACLNELQKQAVYGIDLPSAWGGAFLFMLQIYYDFSGYSDIALGLSNILGFQFKENFDFPYLSTSISEFWRRWHISLGTWFREYVYIPLGGSRRGVLKTVSNLGIVFLLTGIWHGASWNYILWGIINGAVVIFERLTQNTSLCKKLPVFIKWIGTLLIVLFCWQLFRFSSLSECLGWIKIMFGLNHIESVNFTWQYYFDLRMMVLMAVGTAGSIMGTPEIKQRYLQLCRKPVFYGIQQLSLLFLFVLSIICMVNSSYSPFIYFQY